MAIGDQFFALPGVGTAGSASASKSNNPLVNFPTVGGLIGQGESGALGALPGLLAGFQQYAPQFEQAILEDLKKSSPQIAQLLTSLQSQYGPGLASAQRTSALAGAPGFGALQNALVGNITAGIGQGLSPMQTAYFRNQLAQSEASRGLADSPLGSQQEALALTQLNQAQQQQNLQNALNLQQGYRMFGTGDLSQLVPSQVPIGGAGAGAFQAPSVSDATNLASGLAALQLYLKQAKLSAKGGSNVLTPGAFGGGAGSIPTSSGFQYNISPMFSNLTGGGLGAGNLTGIL